MSFLELIISSLSSLGVIFLVLSFALHFFFALLRLVSVCITR